MIKSYKIYNNFNTYEKDLNVFIKIYQKIINNMNNLEMKIQLNIYLIKSKFLPTPFNLERNPGKIKIESNVLEASN